VDQEPLNPERGAWTLVEPTDGVKMVEPPASVLADPEYDHFAIAISAEDLLDWLEPI
jgi:hypothetical protein